MTTKKISFFNVLYFYIALAFFNKSENISPFYDHSLSYSIKNHESINYRVRPKDVII